LQRHICLQVQYDGGRYFGFASQSGDYDETIEKKLFDAFHKLKLIESREVRPSISYVNLTDFENKNILFSVIWV